jgi:hypothetical protein
MNEYINKLLAMGYSYDSIEALVREEWGVDVDMYTNMEGVK